MTIQPLLEDLKAHLSSLNKSNYFFVFYVDDGSDGSVIADSTSIFFFCNPAGSLIT